MENCNVFWLLLAALMVGVSSSTVGVSEADHYQLDYDYYKHSCPNLEAIVKEQVSTILFTDPTSPAAFLRLLFHDCQVQGCDASILLDSEGSEIVSTKNFGIRKREKIQQIKTALEAECPGQVSCADIIALVARESVAFSGGPEIQIPLGRKDSRTSNHQQADIHLPYSGISVDEFLHIFMSKGMNLEESVAILGAHTLGVGHCRNIVDRLYNPHPGSQIINHSFELLLRLECPTRTPLTSLTVVPNDMTPFIFDNHYYRDVTAGNGLFGIDSDISRDLRTVSVVNQFALDQDHFFQVFSSAFVRLSSTNVIGEAKGEVRRICNRVNE
ncbi:hypothetical protein LWI29_000962 [Acer saccharum]|uniref:Peroxidase n=1 Tax=Acer saccharum TaxID=4024 RepID=A0AA39RPJ4_ACESA|nr:hypothetical protein LWI29_000962 [Acer saccharum]